MSTHHWPWRWAWLLALCAAPVIVVALAQDIGARAYDAATEHILRGVAFSNVISEGVLYPRWTHLLHWGLGSPLFTFQPLLPYYGMDVLYRLGLPHPLGWRVLIALGFALAFTGAYLLVREISGRRWPALVAGAAYLYAPYVLRNAIERGSNEAYSVFLYPLVLWSLIVVARRPSTGRFLLGTLFWAACIASHVLGPLILAPFAAGLAGYLAWRYRTAAPVGVLLAGGLLTAFIWLPMGPEQAWVHVERDFSQAEAIPAQNPLGWGDLLAPPVVYDVARDDNRAGDRVGLLQTALLLAALPAAALILRKDRKMALALLAAALAGLFLFFLLTSWSDGLWRIGGAVTARLLYRTRLMGAQALAAAATAGLIVAVLPPRWQKWTSAGLASAFLIAALPSLYVQYQHAYASFTPPVDENDVRAMEIRHGGTALTAFGEFEPRWRSAPLGEALLAYIGPTFDAESRPLAGSSRGVNLFSARVRNHSWDLELSTTYTMPVTLNLLYYPRWEATLDGQPVTLSPEPLSGYAQVSVPEGQHNLALRYGTTGVERAGRVVSGMALSGLLAAAVTSARRGRQGMTGRALRKAPAERQGESPQVALPVLLSLTALLALKFTVVDPATTWFRCVSTAERVCGAQSTVDVGFAGAHRLRGYSVDSYELEVGGELRLRLYWQGEAGEDRPLAAFVHVRNASPDQPASPYSEYGIWAQQERAAWGSLRSTEFVPGRLYEDAYALRLPVDIPEGEYYLEVGWFDPKTGEQADVDLATVKAPLRVLWRSVLLPAVRVAAP